MEKRKRTYSRNVLLLHVGVSRLAVRTRLAGDGQDDHLRISGHTSGDVLELHGEHVDWNQASELATTAVVTVRHGAVHGRIGNDLSSLGLHVGSKVVDGNALGLEGVLVAVLGRGRRLAATEACDGGEVWVCEGAFVVSWIEVRNTLTKEWRATRGGEVSGGDLARGASGRRFCQVAVDRGRRGQAVKTDG